MNKMTLIRFHKYLLTLFFSGFFIFVNAQVSLSVKASVDRYRILIGEPINLTLEANIPDGESIHFFSIDSIPHFEFLEIQKPDTSEINGGVLVRQTIRITSFDSGHWVIPAFVLAINIASDSIPVDVVFADFDPSKDYNDIKNIIEVIPEKKRQWWYGAVAALLLLIGIIYLLLQRKPKPEIKPGILLSPYEEAIKELEKLQKDNPGTKKYYSGLINVFRLYVFRKKGILSLQKTTEDLILQLKSIDLDKEQHSSLFQALRLSDFVKFAKFIPSKEDDIKAFTIIRNSITLIEQSESKNSP